MTIIIIEGEKEKEKEEKSNSYNTKDWEDELENCAPEQSF